MSTNLIIACLPTLLLLPIVAAFVIRLAGCLQHYVNQWPD